MHFGTLEVLASILIAFSVMKRVVISIHPQAWFNFSKKLYVKPEVTSLVALVLAGVVLFFLVNAGVTIVQILATVLFMILLMLVGLAKHGQTLIAWAQAQDSKT